MDDKNIDPDNLDVDDDLAVVRFAKEIIYHPLYVKSDKTKKYKYSNANQLPNDLAIVFLNEPVSEEKFCTEGENYQAAVLPPVFNIHTTNYFPSCDFVNPLKSNEAYCYIKGFGVTESN